ncbi:MAG TPA: tRNA uridine-5-carboxymethylaminomethyl(34) synthesis GTPase MnmE [Allosphingosinicella sp.]|nr:tRNA uridine-5-carboxymethylaminomethyl(34) synthesis GTPase MnmE [Allosphingosinicella sp.]
MQEDTIYALSSGSPPAAIAVIRISGPRAGHALGLLAGRSASPRRAQTASIRHPESGEILDNGLVLHFPAPHSATGEEVAELHLHGGRSVVAAVLDALRGIEGLREARAGEFTRRAFENGRIDLAEAEGLADLLTAETQSQRRAALALAGGALSREVGRWESALLDLAAEVEAVLDFADEGDVDHGLSIAWEQRLHGLREELERALARPPVERLRDGIRVILAGPVNAGKSSLFNALVDRDAAIVSAVPGTTRDLIEAPVAIGGVPFLLVDTAGLRDTGDEIESIGVGRTRANLEAADVILWLGHPTSCPDRDRSILISPKADLGPEIPAGTEVAVSAVSGSGVERLIRLLSERAAALLPHEGEVAINGRHRQLLREAAEGLGEAAATCDLLVMAEGLRLARSALDRITGRAGTEDMLDTLFGRFCIGK